MGGLRPVMTLASGRLVEIAKAGLDSRGFAYLWGEDGELLASIPSVRQEDHRLSNGTQIQFLNGHGSQGNPSNMLTYGIDDDLSVQNTDTMWTEHKYCDLDELEDFSPSTTVPDSPDCTMETD